MKTFKLLLYASFFILSISLCNGQSWDWVKLIQPGDSPQDHFIAADDTGNIYYCDSYLDLYKFDKYGNLLWQWYPTGLLSITGGSGPLAIYPGHEFFLGNFVDSVIIGIDTLVTPTLSNTSFFIACFNSNGQPIWAKQINSARSIGNTVSLSCLSSDKNGNALISGIFYDTAVFDKDTLVSLNGTSMVLAKYSQNGNLKWIKQANQMSISDDAIPASRIASQIIKATHILLAHTTEQLFWELIHFFQTPTILIFSS